MTKDAHYGYARWRMVPLEAVSLTDGFWAQWQNLNRNVTLQHGYEMLDKSGCFDNLRIVAGQQEGKIRGFIFQDSDMYKWLEAVGFELQLHPNAELQKQADGVIALMAAAQENDGYLNSHYQAVEPDKRWSDLDFGHELYCAGHLFQATVAYYRATQNQQILDIATRFADNLVATFGPGKLEGTCGHSEIELALIELYRMTDKQAYLDLSKFFIDQRGKGVMRGLGWMKAEYHQDRVPVREEDIVEGHAVRAMYLNSGVADLYLETGEQALWTALTRQWDDMTNGKMFITGGLGARYEGEAFGDPYELPSDRCYCETCAAIGSLMWNWRMLLVTGESRFADLIERTLYNGILSGLAMDGKHFFYMNPLFSRGGYARQEWYACACCPPNLMRLLASLGQYFVTQDASGLQVHLYNSAAIQSELPSGKPVKLAMQTRYPWDGDVQVSIQETDGSSWTLRLRVPEWSSSATVSVNGQTIQNPTVEAGYIVLERAWKAGDVVQLTLPMEAELMEANPRIDAVRDSVAIQRGPLVYCLEGSDHPEVNLMDVRLDEDAPLEPILRGDVGSEAIVAIQGKGFVTDANAWKGRLYRPVRKADAPRESVPITAIPFYAWGNRGANAMRVWIPRR